MEQHYMPAARQTFLNIYTVLCLILQFQFYGLLLALFFFVLFSYCIFQSLLTMSPEFFDGTPQLVSPFLFPKFMWYVMKTTYVGEVFSRLVFGLVFTILCLSYIGKLFLATCVGLSYVLYYRFPNSIQVVVNLMVHVTNYVIHGFSLVVNYIYDRIQESINYMHDRIQECVNYVYDISGGILSHFSVIGTYIQNIYNKIFKK